VLAEQGGHPGHQAVEHLRVDVEPEGRPAELAAGQHHRVVAGEHALVEQRDPVPAVHRLDHHRPRRRVECGQAAEPDHGLRDAVREERVGAVGDGSGQALVDHLLDVEIPDPGDAGLPQQAEGEHQVGVGVGVDPVAGQRRRQHQPGRDAVVPVAQVGQDGRRQVHQIVGDRPHGAGP
jgi:hypothetical protein